MTSFDVRRNQREAAWTARTILAAKDDELQAAWAVLGEIGTDLDTLKRVTVLCASMAAERMSAGHTEALTAAMVGRLAAPPQRWYPGDGDQ